MSNKTYDVLKEIAIIWLPLIDFVAALCAIWNIPYSVQIVATLTALDAFLGSILKISTVYYNQTKDVDELLKKE